MATRRQPLNLRGLMPGLFAATLLCAVALAAFLALWFSAPGAGWQSVFSDSYLWHVVRFSFWQASLSALISVGPAIFLARALYRRRFPGRTLLLRLCAMTLILPVLVAVFGILSVYGRQGWLASLFHALGWQWEFSPYGLQGILLAQPALWQALSTSLRIAIAAGLLSVTLTMMLLWSSRELRARQRPLAGQAMELSGMLILAMPGIVLATGFFLLLNNTIGLPESADGIVIFTNALMAIPYALKVLENPMRDIAALYSMLCQSLGIEGFARLRVVELRALRRPLAQALAFACVLSIGDFGVVALFGNEAFRTLPFYLYQQIGAYRSQDGAVTALLLLLLCFLLFTLIEKLPGRDAKTQ